MVDRTNPIDVITFHAYVNSVGSVRALDGQIVTVVAYWVRVAGMRFEGGGGICIV